MTDDERTPTPDDDGYTVQLLVGDHGNRDVIGEMLTDRYEVVTSRTLTDADLYLVEDRLLPEYREDLRDRIDREAPAFHPVVVIRRGQRQESGVWNDDRDRDEPVLVDDVIDAPIDRRLLRQRIHSLLVRRQQSKEILTQVGTLKQRERELRRFQRGIEATGNGIAMTNRTGTIEYVNPAFESITGYTGADAVGRTPRLLQPAGADDVFDERFWRTVADRSEWQGEVVVERKDGTRCTVDATVTAIDDGEAGLDDDEPEIDGFAIVMSDVTERIQRERELRNREGELELLRQVLTRYLRHNLRNDLNVILGYARLLAESERIDSHHAAWARTVVETADRLLEKSDTARTYSALLERKAELTPYDLPELTADAVEVVRDRHPDVTIEVDAPDRCRIRAREGLGTAITELVENAAKHNDATVPHVRVRIRNGNGARLVIEDNGPGIPDDEIAALERGDETPLSHSQGIGLWLCKWVIEGVDGSLSFRTSDEGTRVVIEFPPIETAEVAGIDAPALKEREQRLETVIRRMTDAIVELDDDWRLTFIDARAEDILDVDADDVRERVLWEAFADVQGTRFEDVFREVMETRSTEHVEAYYPGIDGWLEAYVYPEFDGGLSVYLRDVTERTLRERELREARDRIEFALSVTDTVVWEWEIDEDVVTTHPEIHAVFRTSVHTIDAFFDAIHPADRSRVRAALDTAVAENEPYRAEYRVRDGDEIRWIRDYGEIRGETDSVSGRGADGVNGPAVDGSSTRSPDGSSGRMVGVARDVTREKRHERALEERVKELTGVHEATRVFMREDAPISELLVEFVDVVSRSFQHPELTEVRIVYDTHEVSTDGFEPEDRSISIDTTTANGSEIELTVMYRDTPIGDVSGAQTGDVSDTSIDEDMEGPFLIEERELLETLVAIAKAGLERRSA